MTLDLSGRVALVTGASRGIGERCASMLAAHGADLLLVSSDAGGVLDAVADRIAAASGRRVLPVALDVADPVSAQAAVKRAHAEFRRLDVLVNNAAILSDARLGMIPADVIARTLSVNVAGVIDFMQASSRLMVRSGGGSIINMASIIGRVGNPGQVAYGASKAAVIGATLSAAKELAPRNIRVNAIAPGYIDTDMTRSLDEATRQVRLDSIGMGRVGTVDDVANVALFLASDLSAYVTGQTIGVDGAMLI